MQLATAASAEKLRGGFYTPPEIASFIAQWGINGCTNLDILEPSCGDGIFLKQIKQLNLPYNSITGIELNQEEAEKSEHIELPNCDIINDDFHTYCNNTHRRFDLVIGNPPYIRYQYFEQQQQIEAEDIFIKAGLKYSKLTNAWVSFVVGASLLLKEEGGKIGFVLPAEILQVSFAKQLRQFLSVFFNKINIISFEKLVFEHIQQEVVLLLCEKNNSSVHHIEHIEVRDIEGLKGINLAKLKNPQKKIEFKSNKWTFYFLDQDEIDFLENVGNKYKLQPLGKFAHVEVGITTGSNSFFTVSLETVEKYDLYRFAKPLVGRSVQVNSAIFTLEDWQNNKNSSARAHLLVFPEPHLLANDQGTLDYIKTGEAIGINKGYKCGIRNDWFIVPSLKIADAMFVRRNNWYPKLVINEAKAYSTDTMHRVFIKTNIDINAFTASYYNSLSLAYTEVCGRSHGGGVLELMPNEAEQILLPYMPDNSLILKDIDHFLRKKSNINDVLNFTDQILLKENFGMSSSEINTANRIWKKLSARRLNRGGK